MTPHPFTRLGNPTGWERTRMVLGLATGFVPLRLAVLAGWLGLGGSTVLCLHRLGFRKASVYFLRWCIRWLLRIAGHRSIPVVVTNNDDVFEPGNCPRIIVSNHISNTEILHLLSLPFRDGSGNPVLPVFVMKESVLKVPFVGTIARDVMGCITVARRKRANNDDDGSSSSSSSPAGTTATGGGDSCTEQILSRVRDGRGGPVVIFPEGTTTNGTCLLAFKTGAFAPMVPVRPLLYRFGPAAAGSRSDPARSSPSSWSSSSAFLPTYESIWGPAYLWRLASQPFHELSCEFLDPVEPPPPAASAGSADPPSVFAEHVRSEMARRGNLPMVPPVYDYRHKLRYHAGLMRAFRSHPRGPKYAMCFEPMLPVFPEPPGGGLPDGGGDKDNRPGPYDCVVGTKWVPVVPPPPPAAGESGDGDSREKKDA